MIELPSRNDYLYFSDIATRWHDNDLYGHVNNVVYYAYFDSAVNRYLIDHGGLDIQNGDIIAFVVSSHCDYFSPLAFPQNLTVGIRVNKIGNSSVQYALAIFAGDQSEAAAAGEFVHVFVDRHSQQAVAIPDKLRHCLQAIAFDMPV